MHVLYIFVMVLKQGGQCNEYQHDEEMCIRNPTAKGEERRDRAQVRSLASTDCVVDATSHGLRPGHSSLPLFVPNKILFTTISTLPVFTRLQRSRDCMQIQALLKKTLSALEATSNAACLLAAIPLTLW